MSDGKVRCACETRVADSEIGSLYFGLRGGAEEEKKSMLLVMRVLSILPLNFKVSGPIRSLGVTQGRT